MPDVVVLRAVIRSDSSELAQGLITADKDLRDWAGQERPPAIIRVGLDKADLDKFEAEQREAAKRRAAQPAPTTRPASARPSTQSPEKIAKTTAAAVEQTERTSQARQTSIAQEGEAKRAAIESQGAQRRVNAESEANSRREAQERAHLQRMIQDKERAEQKLAMKPRMTSAQRGEAIMNTGQRMMGSGAAMTAGATAPMALGAGLVLREGIKWEDAFAGVKKQVPGSQMELKGLEMGLRGMAAGKNAIPVDKIELAGIAENAGQLGIAKENILAFTKTMAEMKVTTNMTSEEAATSMAQIANVTKLPQTEFERLGSTIVALGNDGASTEKEITELTQRLAAAGAQVGMSVPEIAGFGSALASAGVNAESGGTGVSNAWKNIDKIVRAGGKDLDELAKVAGMSAEQYKNQWQTNAAGASTAFLQGLDKMKKGGGDAFGTLNKLGFNDSQMQDALLRLAGASDILSSSLKTGKTAWKENTALADEAKKKFETTSSQLEILQNRVKEGILQLSDSVLKDANASIGNISKSIPEASQKIAAGWEALGPAGKKAALGMLAVVALSGPLTTLAGTIGTIYGGLMKVSTVVGTIRAASAAASAAGAAGSAAAGAGAAGAGASAGGLAAAVPLLANPATLVILTAAVIALAGAWAMYQERLTILAKAHKDVEDNTKNLTQDLDILGKASSGNHAAETTVKRISKSVNDAGKDVGKLDEALDKVAAARREVKNLKLSPAAEALVTQQYDTLASRIESRIIKVQVEMDEQSKSWWDQFKEDLERDDWVPKGTFFKGGNQDGKTPEQIAKERKQALEAARQYSALTNGQPGIPNARRGVTAAEIMHLHRTGNVDALRNAKSPKERGDILRDLQVGKASESVLKGIWTYYDRLVKANPGYIFDPTEGRRWGEVIDQVNVYDAKRKKAAKDAEAEATRLKGIAAAERKTKAEAAAEAQKKIDEALSDQRRAETGRSLEGQLTQFNGANQAIEGQLGRIAQLAEEGAQSIGDAGEKTAEAKARAETLKDEWDAIPQSIKNSHIELAGIEVQMSKINGLAQSVGQRFDDIGKGLSDADFEKFSAFVSKVEGSLDLGGQRTALINRANQVAGNTLPVIQGVTRGLQDKLNANQLSSRQPFDDPTNPSDGNMVSVARTLVGQTGANPQVAGKAFGEEWCVGFVQTVRKNAGLPELANGTLAVKGLRSWAKNTGRATNDPQAGDVFTVDNGKQRHAAIVASRVGNKVTTIGGNEGAKNNYASKVKEGATYNINAPGVMFIRPEDAARTSKAVKAPTTKAPVDPRQNWSFEKQQKLVGADGLLPWERAQNAASKPTASTAAKKAPVTTVTTTKNTTATGDYVPDYKQNGKLLDRMRLPKSFGGSMSQYRAKEGESTSVRQAFEQQLRDILSAADETKTMKDGTVRARFGKEWKSISPWAFRQEGERLEASKGAFDTRTGGINRVRDARRDLGQRSALAGRDNEYLRLSNEMESGQYRGNTNAERQSILASTRGAMMAEATAANKDFIQSEGDKQKVLAAGKPFLDGASSDLAAYERETAAAQARVQAWNKYQPFRDIADKMESRGDKKGAQDLRAWSNKMFHSEENVTKSSQNAETIQAAERSYASLMVAQKEELGLLEYEAKLLREGKLSRDEMAAAIEGERVKRESMKTFIDSASYHTPDQIADFEKRATTAGEGAAQKVRENQGQGRVTSQKDYNDAISDNIALLEKQKQVYASYGLNNPQLQVELETEQERQRLLNGDFKGRRGADGALTPEATTELNERLRNKRKELETERDMSVYVDSRRNAEDAQLRVLEMQKDARLKLVQTERERLVIEQYWQDLVDKRKNGADYEPLPEEKAARQGQLEQADVNDQIDASRRAGEQAHQIFRDSISEGVREGWDAGLKGFSERLQQAWMDAAIDKLARKAARVPDDPTAPSGSVLGDLWRNSKNVVPLLPGIETSRGPLSPIGLPAQGPPLSSRIDFQTPPYIQNVLNGGMFGSTGGIMAQVQAALGAQQAAAMNASNVTINTNSTNVNSGVTNMSGAGPLFGKRGGKGGGSGTTASVSQLLGIPMAGPGL